MDIAEIETKVNPGQFSEYDMVSILPELDKLHDGDIYLEIGVDRGRSLSFARMITKEGVKVYGVDIEDVMVSQPQGTTFIHADSSETATRWENGKISILFIDGDHTYKGCKKDIDSWLPHMKDNGVVFFHDYDITSPGVIQAVDEFVAQYPAKEFKVFATPEIRTSMAMIKL